ncbi:O-antigen ligase family protein [Alteriqipengyuania lutimaris]|uniref:O-antigen ligase domain-containing protein n=1 Tax=Alteriqipengyuania lutimaris TaxID=1538146 RepID=A0A395LL80_9SPHN|nr:O-antigen ligase family protein [Alteriqipengyuania lutimaris]MBB3033265.1 O-antigen ligase [Alteriqipengyuania lutimaris]RDS77692.1 O-antigen ligase domain-containing protein [Alteriqipengyuania lutimaris]
MQTAPRGILSADTYQPTIGCTAQLTLPGLALGIALTTLVSAVLFATYQIALPNRALEGLRQTGVVFLAFEALVIILAMARGFEVGTLWNSLTRFTRFLLVVFFATFLWGGLVHSPAAAWATMVSLSAPFHVIFAFAIAHSLRPFGAAAMDVFEKIIFVAMAIFAVLVAVHFLTPPPAIDPVDIKWYIAVPGFISHRLLGAFAGGLLALFVADHVLRYRDSFAPWWAYGALVLLTGLTVWTGTRAALLGIGIALPVAWLCGLPRPTGRQAIALSACAALGIGLAILAIPYGSPHFRLFNGSDVASADAVSGGRLVYWSFILDAIAEHPLIGAGSGASMWILPAEAQQHIQPHNVVLQFLLSWGAFATAAALMLLAKFVRAVHVIAARHPSALPFLALLDCLLVVSLLDGMFHFARHFMLMMLASGVIFAIERHARGIDKPGAHA